jgi:hypothetical protein
VAEGGFFRGFPIPGDLDLTEDGRDFVLVSGASKVLQSIKTRAQIYKGSWRYDRSKGVPYFQEILVAGVGVELVRRRFHELLIGTDGVTGVRSLEVAFDPTSATINVSFVVSCDEGLVNGALDFEAVS